MISFLKKISTERSSWLLLAFTALTLELIALYFQHVMALAPCVMCVYERLAVLGLVFSGFLGASNPENLLIRMSAFIIWAVSAVWGLMLALEHAGLQMSSSPFATCDFLPNFPEWAPLHQWFPWLFNPTGDCTQVVWTMLNYSMPQWLVLGFGLYCLSLVVVLISMIIPSKK